jgi:hypothetical protein
MADSYMPKPGKRGSYKKRVAEPLAASYDGGSVGGSFDEISMAD